MDILLMILPYWVGLMILMGVVGFVLKVLTDRKHKKEQKKVIVDE